MASIDNTLGIDQCVVSSILLTMDSVYTVYHTLQTTRYAHYMNIPVCYYILMIMCSAWKQYCALCIVQSQVWSMSYDVCSIKWALCSVQLPIIGMVSRGKTETPHSIVWIVILRPALSLYSRTCKTGQDMRDCLVTLLSFLYLIYFYFFQTIMFKSIHRCQLYFCLFLE